MGGGASPALAQGGTGLYEPFPAPRAEEHAIDFVHGLRGDRQRLLAVTSGDLDHGVVLASGANGATGPAGDRGESAAGFSPSLGWLPALALLVAAVAGVRVLTSRRT
jgi:hypothetical protein